MKMKSIAGLTCYVKDLGQTAAFYEALGFQFKRKDQDRVSVYLNWFWIDFIPLGKEERPDFLIEGNQDNTNSGLYLYISVDNVDDSYNELLSKGLKPAGIPKERVRGIREFLVIDPDGYKLMFFRKK